YLSDLKSALDNDRLSYQKAIIAACGIDAAELAKRFARAYHDYADTLLGPEQAARELGCTPAELRTAFTRFVTAKGSIDPELGGLLAVPPEPIVRLHWEELFPLAQRYLAGDLRD